MYREDNNKTQKKNVFNMKLHLWRRRLISNSGGWESIITFGIGWFEFSDATTEHFLKNSDILNKYCYPMGINFLICKMKIIVTSTSAVGARITLSNNNNNVLTHSSCWINASHCLCYCYYYYYDTLKLRLNAH